MMKNVARIIKIVSNQYTVAFDGETHLATAMGKLRLGVKPLVGDFVRIEFLENKWVIQDVLERKNALIRPALANIDQALVVMSTKEPDFSYRLVDRLIFLIAYEDIEPILVINKTDLVDGAVLESIQSEYVGYRVYDSHKGQSLDHILPIFEEKVTVLAGQSGVGKSSLINRIDASFELQTQEISRVLGRGKHTTRHNQLYRIADGWVADTPGFSSLDFTHLDKHILAQKVPDFKNYWQSCRFRNCIHVSEPGCAVKIALEQGEISKQRYTHYCESLELIGGN